MSTAVHRQRLQSLSKIKTLSQAAFLLKQIICQLEGCFDVALDVEVIVDVSFSQCEFAGREKHLSQRSRMLEHQRESLLLFRYPGSAVPQPNLKISLRVVCQERLQELGVG